MTDDELLRICPSEEALIDIKHQIKCPFETCDYILPQTGSLQAHLIKFHGVIKDENNENLVKMISEKNVIGIKTQYHCPLVNCVYGVHSERHFSNINLLRQHYRKVHAEKKYKCEKCGIGFGMEKDKKMHEVNCGNIYKCLTCDGSYRSPEAIMMHCKRKGHQLPDGIRKGRRPKSLEKEPIKPESTKPDNVVKSNITTNPPTNVFIINIVQPESRNSALQDQKLLKPILPKPLSISIVPIAPVTMVSNCVQVDTQNSSTSQKSSSPGLTQPDSSSSEMNVLKVKKYPSRTISTGCQISPGTQVPPGSPRSKKGGMNLHKRRKSFTGSSATSTGIQTSISIVPQKKKCMKNVAQTQTAGDFILKTAMATADIPIQSESVGTQITPKAKIRNARHRKTCNIETQTTSTAGQRRKRKKKLFGSEELAKTDSVCQTTDSSRTVSVECSTQIWNKNMVNESAQTVMMVDENSQTVPYHVLQNHIENQSVNVVGSQSLNSGIQNESLTSLPASDILQNFSKSVLNSSDSGFEENITLKENTSPLHVISIPESNIAPTDQSVNSCVETSANSDAFLYSNITTKSVSTTSREREQSVNSSGVQASLGDLDLLTATWSVKENQVSLRTDSFPVAMTTSLKAVDIQENLDFSESHNIGIQTFESDLEDFLMQCNSEVGNESRIKAVGTSDANYSSNSQFTSHTLTSSQTFASQTGVLATSTDSVLSFSGKTELAMTDITSYPTVDTHVQTLSSASDIDQLLQTACSGIQTDDVYSSMNIHTQTADDFDVLDLLMNNMETQTTDDLTFDGFSLADIQTQTTNEIDTSGVQATTATQTQSGIETLLPNKNDASNMETQTPYQALFNFPMTDTHTQTTWQDLDEILSELNKKC